ncbi:MAG: tRNA (adenosine(37)-N6)-threonylcarbamoyltransferase complex dimerization subunit type 1 TsaB [Gammaproteobacteria bacterium]|nr:tRNA (adenosine(37)-N6)-threonylcarbamoyltransferase complex dimerization subunit type 1 TsaB [Gammaproteobacteria bacterium]
MNILAIDTCTEVTSITLCVHGGKSTRVLRDVAKSSGHILALCDEVFSEAGIKLKDVDAIAYTKGPGAFTGVRMCIGVVQGLSLSADIPTIGFSTLELLGYRAAKHLNCKAVAVALDARMGEVYWGLYQQGVFSDEKICNPSEVDKLNSGFVGVGSGWSAYSDELKAASGVEQIDTELFPKSSSLVDLAYEAFVSGSEASLDLAQPTYLRNNVAQKSKKVSI